MGPEVGSTVRELDVRSNTLTPWWRVRMTFAEGRLTVAWTETALGLIPLRRRRLDIRPEALWLAPRFYPDRLAAALVLVIAAVLLGGWWRVALACAAVLLGAISLILVLHVRDPDGETRIPACILQRQAIAAFLSRRDPT